MTPLPAPAELIYAVGMAAVAVNAASAVLETEDKGMDLVGAVIVGLATGVHWLSVSLLGVITGVVGGMLRDILVNEVPLVMRPGTLYATASWFGALTLLGCLHFGLGDAAAAVAGAAVVLGLRLAAIRWRLSLPTYKSR